jgi:hypothetical protein
MACYGLLSLGSALLLAVSAQANLDLSNLTSQTVKAGQPWANIESQINSLGLDVQINRGVVTTVVTLAYTPGYGIVQSQICTAPVKCDTRKDPNCANYCTNYQTQQIFMDSLEVSSWFVASDNTAITDMSLWVGDVKVKAALQDRALASAQYEDIVKRRKDPALIETMGNGSYSLRIFPNQSATMRKLEITFVQGMENNGDLFSTILPIVASLASSYSPNIAEYTAWPKRKIGEVTLNAVAIDGKSYNLNWDGLGKGTISSVPLKLSALNVAELKEGVVSQAGATCKGCLDAWVSEKAGTGYFGVKSLLDFKNLKLESEPMDRDIIVDVDGTDSLIPARSRKLALLSLKAYAQSPYRGNLGFSDGKGNITYVFAKPVTMDAANLNKAYTALKAWTPIAKANSKMVLEAYAGSHPKGGPTSVAILINNEPYPYYAYPPVITPFGSGDMTKQIQAFEDAQQKNRDDLVATLAGSNTILFGYWSNYRLGNVAQATGGYQLGAIEGWVYPPYRGGGIVMDSPGGTGIINPDPALPTSIKDWYMPPLFGAGRNDAGGVSNLSVKTSGLAIDKLVVLQETQNYAYYGGPIMMDMAVRSDMVGPYRYQAPETTIVRLGGQYQGSGKVTFTLSGTWGGLKFSQNFSADLSLSSGAGEIGSAIWASQQTEALGRDYLTDDLLAMQKLGHDYHVVNRQMSLLALEPGMGLWTDMPTKPSQTGTTNGRAEIGAPVSSDQKIGYATNGSNLDASSLEEILNGTITGIEIITKPSLGNGELTLSKSAGMLQISWDLRGNHPSAHFQIISITGRTVANLSVSRIGKTFSANWRPEAKTGTYYLKASAGSATRVQKISFQH